jgi:hypothetical protein
MTFNPIATEFVTGLTDAILAIECVVLRLWFRRGGVPWRVNLWGWVFGLVGFASVLGAVAHGLDLTETVRTQLWRPLYLSLGVLVGLFAVGAVGDWRGPEAVRRLVPWGVGVGVVFFVVTQLGSGAFLVFVAYEAAAMLAALAIYGILAGRGRPGAAVMAAGVLLNLAAAGVQASSLAVSRLALDHNGLFHLVQMAGMAVLALGVRRSARE